MEIPSRVNCQTTIEVRLSEISGAGRGVFALADIKAGELIFSIAKPLVAVVSVTSFSFGLCFVAHHGVGGQKRADGAGHLRQLLCEQARDWC
jgi:hypothetical protein